MSEGQLFKDIADAIRRKTGGAELMTIQEMPAEIDSIQGIIDISTAAEMDAKLTIAHIGEIYHYTGTTTATYVNGRYYRVQAGRVTLQDIASYYPFATSTRRTDLDPEIYGGFFQSENYNVNSSNAVVKVTIKGFSTFKVYINSYSESNYDYTILTKLDATAPATEYNAADVISHTRGFQKDPTGQLSTNYKSYTFTAADGLDTAEHHFYITYHKDGSAHSNDDRGYFTYEIGGAYYEEMVAIDGKIYITTTAEQDVSQYKTAIVQDGNLSPDNIKKDITILGVTGTFEGGGGTSGYKVFFINVNDNYDNGTFEHNEDGAPYEITQGNGSGSVALSIMAGIETLKLSKFDHWTGGLGSASASWGAWRPHQSNWETWRGAGGTIISNAKTTTTLTLTQDIDLIIHSGTCLAGDTLILMADGSLRRIDAVKVGDKVKGPDGTINSIIYSDADATKYGALYDEWIFSDGTVVKTINPHRFYNCERGAFVYMAEWQTGEHALNTKGEEIALIGHRRVTEKIRHYTIFTDGQNVYYANGLLSGNRHSTYKRAEV